MALVLTVGDDDPTLAALRAERDAELRLRLQREDEIAVHLESIRKMVARLTVGDGRIQAYAVIVIATGAVAVDARGQLCVFDDYDTAEFHRNFCFGGSDRHRVEPRIV